MAVLLYPQKLFAVRSLLAGDFPLWNPYLFCGMPFHACAHPGLLYPPNLLFLVLPLAAAFNVLFMLHVALAGVFTYALMRDLGARTWPSLFAAVAFAFSARLLLHVHVGQLPQVAALAWIPGLFWFAIRLVRSPGARRAIELSTALACSILAGYPQYPIYAAIALLLGTVSGTLLAPARRIRGLLVVVLALAGGALLAAAQVLPSLAYAADSFRSQAPLKFISNGYLPIENLSTFLFPFALGDSIRSWYFGKWGYAEMIFYLGVAPIAFGAYGLVSPASRRRCVPWLILFVVSIVLALGAQTPVFEVVRRIPVLGSLRGISKFGAVGLLGLAVCAGLSLDSLLVRNQATRAASSPHLSLRWVRFAGPASLVGILAVLMSLGLCVLLAIRGDAGSERIARLYHWVASGVTELSPGKPHPQLGGLVLEMKQSLATNATHVVLCAGGLCVLALFARRALGPLVVLLLAIDLFTTFDPFLETMSVSRDILPSAQVAQALSDVPPLSRFAGPRAWLMRGICNTASAIGGWEGNLPRRTQVFFNYLAGRPTNASSLAFEPSSPSPLIDLLVAQRLLSTPDLRIDDSRYRVLAKQDELIVYDRTVVLPRAYIVHDVEIVSDCASVWAAIQHGDLDPYRIATVERVTNAHTRSMSDTGISVFTKPREASVRLQGPDRVVVRAETEETGLLVLLDPYDTGWKATDNGRAANVVPVFGFFRGVYLEEGAHTVVFSYTPEAMTVGVAISVVSTIVALFVWARACWRR